MAAQLPTQPDTRELVDRFPELASVEVDDMTIDGPHATVPTRRYRVPGLPVKVAFVWVHGGGFISGDLSMPEAHWVGLMLASRGVPVLSIDYHKCLRGVHFPIPSDDVLAAWLWAVGHANELGTTAEHLHIGGASAGAKLAAGVTKRLRDGAGPSPASLVLAYPSLHRELPPPSAELSATLGGVPTGFTADDLKVINLQFRRQ